MANSKIEIVREWNEFPDLAVLEFDKKVQEYRKYHDLEATAKARKDELKVEIEAALMVVGEKKLKVGELTAMRMNGSTPSQIDAHQLVEAGVDPDIIAACTIKGTAYTYIQVTRPKTKANTEAGGA